MLQLNQVSLRRGSRLLIADINLQVHAGQRLGLTGANGCGKTSLFEMILGRLEPDQGTIALPPGVRIGQVAQEGPRSSRSALDFVLDGDSELREIQAQLAALERQHDAQTLHPLYERMDVIDGYSAESRAAQLLAGLGFAPLELRQSVAAFSGGWRMRLSLAQALMCRSDLLLLDEPTNHLDLPAILWLEGWLKRYPGILVIISHDRDFLDSVCNRIAHVDHQALRVYTGNYSQFEEVRSTQLAQQQALYSKQQREIQHIQSYVERFRYKASKARQAQSRLKMLERMVRIAPAHVDSPFHFEFFEAQKQPQHLLSLEQVDAGYEVNHPVLRQVNLTIAAGQRLGLLGVNGAGKSTLVKALCDGSTVLTGERVIHRDTRIGYFAQHQLDLLHAQQSPMDHLRAQDDTVREQDLRNYLGRFGFDGERIYQPVEPFSGGEKARLVLALMIRQRPNLLLLDEPTNHLDLEMRQALGLALTDYAGALVVISHDRHLLRTVCDELLMVHSGRAEIFDQSIDDYPAWLAAQTAAAAARPGAATTEPQPGNKRQQRQAEAQRRIVLKPLSDRVRAIERELEQQRAALQLAEARLAEETLYTDPARRTELTGSIQSRAQCAAAIEQLEWQWLEASETLERAQQEISSGSSD